RGDEYGRPAGTTSNKRQTPRLMPPPCPRGRRCVLLYSNGASPWRSSRCRIAFCRPATDFKTAPPLLVLLLPLPLDVELLLLAPELRCTFPFELVPGDRVLVLDGGLVINNKPLV